MRQIVDYLNLLAGEHQNKPKYTATVSLVVAPFAALQEFLFELPQAFDLDTAVGTQLDIDGLWIGRSRFIDVPLPDVFFSFDTPNLGWNEGVWFGPFTPSEGLVAFDDATYRALLKTKIIANSWNGTLLEMQQALQLILNPYPSTLLGVIDNYDGSMSLGLAGTYPPRLIFYLVTGNYVPFKPEGVKLNTYVTSINSFPLFGMDVGSNFINGLDVGAWGVEPIEVTLGNVASQQTTALLTGRGAATANALWSARTNALLSGSGIVVANTLPTGLAPLFGAGSVTSTTTVLAAGTATMAGTVFIKPIPIALFAKAAVAGAGVVHANATVLSGGAIVSANATLVGSGVASVLVTESLAGTQVGVPGQLILASQTPGQAASGSGGGGGGPTAPGPVTNISVTASSTTDIHIGWSAPDSNADTYKVTWGLSATNQPNSQTVSVTNFDATGLVSGTNYFFTVTAIGPTGLVGPTTAAGPFATGSVTQQPITFNNIPAFAGSPFSVTGSLTGFSSAPTLAWFDDSGSPSTSGITSTTTTWTIAQHAAWSTAGNHTLTVEVSGNSATANTDSYTVAAAYAPPAPTGIVQSGGFGGGPTDTSIPITWNPPDSNQTYLYNIGYGTSPSGPFTSFTTNIVYPPFGLTITGLLPSTAYYFQVTAIAPGGIVGTPGVSATPISTAQGIPPGTAFDPNVSVNVDFGFTVTNLSVPSGSNPLTMHVEVSTNATSGFTQIGTVDLNTANQLVINSLSAGTSYYVRVRATNPYGTGGYSNVIGPNATRNGNVVNTTQISGNAPTAHAINVAMMADGYTSAQQSQFITDCNALISGLASDAYYSTQISKFNFFAVSINSLQSTSGTSGGVASYFGTSANASGVGQIGNSALASTTAAQQVPGWTVALIVCNNIPSARFDSATLTTSGGFTIIDSNEPYYVLAHELGHALFDLADEYDLAGFAGTQAHWTQPEPIEANVTTITNRATTKWASQISGSTALPTQSNTNGCTATSQVPNASPNGIVGLYEGASYTFCGIYRPMNTCRMMSLVHGSQNTVTPFCPVCINAANARIATL